MNKTYIVTGGFGFIGSNLTNTLLSLGYLVIVIDKLSYAANINNINYNNNLIFLKNDISDNNFVNEFYKRFYNFSIDGIFHLAAESHVDNSISNPYPFIDSNIKGTLNMIEFGRKLNVRILYCSTDEVVGSIDNGFADELYPLVTNSVYSASKASAELLCQAYVSTHKSDIVITRCGNNFGPNQHKEKMIPKIIYNALNNIEIPIYGDGNNIRQWTYVQNHVDDLILVMEKGTHGNIYNIGGGEHFNNNQIVDIILNKLNKSKNLIRHIEDRKGHDFRYAIKINKNVIEWRNKPYISFLEGINKLIGI